MPIITYGIFLPNGRFLPNDADGHAKNACRFCEHYPELNQLRNNANDLKSDDFLITAECGIVVGYNGNRCFKVAVDNGNPVINNLAKEYKDCGFEIWPYWNINNNYKNSLDIVIEKMPKMTVIVRNEVIDIMNLYGKVGFLIEGKFYSNSGRGHEANARDIIHEKGWDSEWNNGNAQDFLVLHKRAIQIGSGIFHEKIIASREFYNESKIEKVAKMYNIIDYSHDLIR